jgi:Zn-dependent membrane protease YugP
MLAASLCLPSPPLSFVTLPVEFDATSRALVWLSDSA